MLFGKNRRIELDILTIFVLLTSLCTAAIIGFTYQKNESSLVYFSKGAVQGASQLLEEKIEGMFIDMEKSVQLTSAIFARHPEVTLENSELVSFLLDDLKFQSSLYGSHDAAFVITPEGKFIGAVNIAIAGKPTMAHKIPDNTVYAVAFRSGDTGQFIYYDAAGAKVGEEAVSFEDVSQSDWFKDAVHTDKISWSGMTALPFTGEMGVVAADGVNGNVVAADLSLDHFFAFLTDQKIGKSGRVYILDKDGKILYPQGVSEFSKVVEDAFALEARRGNRSLVVESGGSKYIVSVSSFPTRAEKGWQMVTIVPFADYFKDLIAIHREVIWVSIGILFLSALLTVYFALRISRPISILADEIDKMQRLELDSDVVVESKIHEIHLLAKSVATVKQAMRSFVKYIPKEIVKKLLQMGHELKLGGERREVTLLFTDITELSPLAETLELEHLNAMLLEYFDGMSKIILRNGGAIDKFIGDGIMVFWNAPDDVADHLAKGCKCALMCQAFATEFNEKQKIKKMPEFKTRIGLNTGTVIAGNLGTQERMSYTVIGDVVNMAERFEQLNKIYQTKTIVGDAVVSKMKDKFLFRAIDITEIKGKKEKAKIYELVAEAESASAFQKQFVIHCNEGFNAFQEGKKEEAKVIFQKIHAQYPNDVPTQMYLKLLENP